MDFRSIYLFFFFADLILYNFANDLEANVFEEQHWYSVMAKTYVRTLFASHWVLSYVRHTLAVHDRLSLGFGSKTGFPEWGKTGL